MTRRRFSRPVGRNGSHRRPLQEQEFGGYLSRPTTDLDRQRDVRVLTQLAWTVDAMSVLWLVTVVGILVCGGLFLAFRE